MMFLSALLFSSLAFGVENLDQYRWFLKPDGQKVEVDIDDLHTEILTASPKADWGWSAMEAVRAKRPVTIAVLDGGIDSEHPDIRDFVQYNDADCLPGRIIPPKDHPDTDKNGYAGDCAGWNFAGKDNRPEDDDGHGTHVTGVITTILRRDPSQIKILPLKVFVAGEGRKNIPGLPPLANRLTDAFLYAIERKADIIHFSGGWPKDMMTANLAAAVKQAVGRGIAVIVAAGNSSQQASIWPCQIDGVICVGALRATGVPARFSNTGQQVDLFAPGERIMSSIPLRILPLHFSRAGYDYKNGTSQAAPVVSAAFAYLLSVLPGENRDSIFARLFSTADLLEGGSGLRGVFHLDRALQTRQEGGIVLPVLKSLSSILVQADRGFRITFPVKNFSPSAAVPREARLSCNGAQMTASVSIGELKAGERQAVNFDGVISGEIPHELECRLSVGRDSYSLRSRVVTPLPAPAMQERITSTVQVVVPRMVGATSRLITVPAIGGKNPQPIYYLSGGKEYSLFARNRFIGALPNAAGCDRLRLWQIDLDGDGANDFIRESMCDKKYLLYEFFSSALTALWAPVRFEPRLTTVNYDEFEIIFQKDAPPRFRFVNNGFLPAPGSPWDDDDSKLGRHLYLLNPVLKDGLWSYETQSLENVKLWSESLGLRFTPSYQVLHLVGRELLVRVTGKTVWVDIETQKARWAGLDEVLWGGDTLEKISGSSDVAFQMMLTPFDFRSYVLGGPKLRFRVENPFDPILQPFGTFRTDAGYRLVVKTFLHLWVLDFDTNGNRTGTMAVPVDKFDFLAMAEQASVISRSVSNGKPIFVVDGTRLNSQHIDVIRDGEKKSWEVPPDCASQLPVEIEGGIYLPVFCYVDREHFDTRFISLSK